MYAQYDGLIFDMDGTLLDTEPTHRQAWTDVLGRYGMRFDLQAMIALNGSPTWRIAQAVIELNQADLDPHQLAREKTDAVKAILLDTVQPLPLIDVVKEWHGRRPMSVGTGSESAIAEALLNHLGLRHYFSAVVAVTPFVVRFAASCCRSWFSFVSCSVIVAAMLHLHHHCKGCRYVSNAIL